MVDDAWGKPVDADETQRTEDPLWADDFCELFAIPEAVLEGD
jgi:hypothetical protein